MFCMLEGGGGHTDSVFVFVVFFDQFSCKKFLDVSYGLKVIDFQSFNQLKAFSGFLLLLNPNIIQNIIQNSTDMWDPHVSLWLLN